MNSKDKRFSKMLKATEKYIKNMRTEKLYHQIPKEERDFKSYRIEGANKQLKSDLRGKVYVNRYGRQRLR